MGGHEEKDFSPGNDAAAEYAADAILRGRLGERHTTSEVGIIETSAGTRRNTANPELRASLARFYSFICVA